MLYLIELLLKSYKAQTKSERDDVKSKIQKRKWCVKLSKNIVPETVNLLVLDPSYNDEIEKKL